MYNEIKQQYQTHRDEVSLKLKETKKKLYTLGTLRLAVVVLAVLFAILFTSLLYYIIGLGVVLFAVLMYFDNKQQKEKDFLETAIRCDDDELQALNYDFYSFDGAPEMVDASHSFSLDLDIFGNNSLFQSVNRTCTNYGKRMLVSWFAQPLKEKTEIERRQKAVAELKGKREFMRCFRIFGLIHPGKESDYEDIKAFIHTSDYITSPNAWRVVSWVVLALWVVLIALAVLAIIPGTWLIWYYILSFIVSESKAKQVNALQNMAGDKVKTLQAYARLIKCVEEEDFQSARLKELQAIFLNGKSKASAQFKYFAQLTNELEQRSNLLVHVLFNPLMLWDIRKTIRLEEWKKERSEELVQWIEVLGEIDAFCSLGTFAYNHPDYTFPVICNDYFRMKGTALGHPLMNADQCIRNDIDIEKHPYFLIITGANMAGKSTYLRVVGVNFVLACIGAPVCAENLEVSPASIVTSLRTSDSLNDNESYFFAELKRLKMIIDRLQQGERLFIILDEILKGTNSVDKQKGSLALVEQFINLDTCGIIATHDLLLGTLEKEFPGNIKNYRFEAGIKDDKLEFTYHLQEGIAQNMNASYLMKKMGITVRS